MLHKSTYCINILLHRQSFGCIQNICRTLASANANISNSVNTEDVERLGQLADKWWDTSGSVKLLHSLNDLRVPFIRDGLIATQRVRTDFINTGNVLDGVQLLEVGCGGGILTEQISRLKAKICGIDPGEDLINVAIDHLKTKSKELEPYITYKKETIELHSKNNLNKYDGVIVSEVIEHVKDQANFLSACVDTLKPGGSIFITTFNKTFLSWFGGIILAEKILKLIPDKTHDWNNFVSLVEMQRILESLNCSVILVNGFAPEFWKNTWRWIPNLDISYAIQAVKNV